MTKVFKFGGALMKNADGIRRVASLVSDFSDKRLVVVVSALGKTTNALELLLKFFLSEDRTGIEKVFIQIRRLHFEIAESLFGNARHGVFDELNDTFEELNQLLNRTFENRYEAYDQIVSYGEMFSAIIVNAFFKENNIPSRFVDARSIIVTDSNFTSASIDWKFTRQTVSDRLMPLLEKGEIVLTQGFIGADKDGNTTTLGREGSDFTAALIANILDASGITIWKDVPGIMNADPARFDDCHKLDRISYHEAIELAFFGASVIHPRTIQPAQHKNTPLYVRSFFDPESFTLISDDTSGDDQLPKIILKDNQALLSIGSRQLAFIAEENLTRIFETFSKHKIHINMMQNSAVSFSVCFNDEPEKLEALIDELKEEFFLKYNSGLQLITIRYYNGELINELTAGKKIFLEQRSRNTIQMLVR